MADSDYQGFTLNIKRPSVNLDKYRVEEPEETTLEDQTQETPQFEIQVSRPKISVPTIKEPVKEIEEPKRPDISIIPEAGAQSGSEIEAEKSKFGKFIKKLGTSPLYLAESLANTEKVLASNRLQNRMKTFGPNTDPSEIKAARNEYRSRIAAADAIINALPEVERDQIYKRGMMKHVENGLVGMARFIPLLPVYAMNPGVGWAASWASMYGDEYNEYRQKGASHETAEEAANLSATLQSVAESAGGTIQAGTLAQILGVKKLAGKMVGGQLAERLGKVTAKPFVKKAVAPVLIGLTEGTEEVTQRELKVFADVLAENPNYTTSQYWSRVLDVLSDPDFQVEAFTENFPAGFIGGLALGGTAAGAKSAIDKAYKRIQSEEDVSPTKDTKKKPAKKKQPTKKTKPAAKKAAPKPPDPAQETIGEVVEENIPPEDATYDPVTGEIETPEMPTFTLEGEGGTEVQGIGFTPIITDVKEAKFNQTDLTQPGLWFDDGTVIEGPQISSEWTLSKLTNERADEITNAFEAAEQAAIEAGRDPDDAIAGWQVGKNFIANSTVGQKIKLREKAKKTQTKLEQETLPDRYLNAVDKKARDQAAKAQKRQQLRDKGTREDRVAMGMILKEGLINKAARSWKNASTLADPIDIGDLKQEAHARAWELVLTMPKSDIEAYLKNPRKNRKVPGTIYQGLGWHLNNFTKEFRGQLTGRGRADVEREIDAGTFKSDLPYEETVTETGGLPEEVGRPDDVDMAEEAGQVRKVSVEEYQRQKAEELARREAKETAGLQEAKKVEPRLATEDTARTRKVQAMKEKLDVEKAKKTTPSKKVQKAPEKAAPRKKPAPRKTPSEKLAAKAKPAKKKGVKTLEARIEAREKLKKRVGHKWSKEAMEKFDRDTELMMEEATKPNRNILSDETRVINTEILNNTMQGVWDAYDQTVGKLGDSLSVMYRWKEFPNVAKAMKNIFSRQDAEEQKGVRDAKFFIRIVGRTFKGQHTPEDLANILLAAESSNLENHIKKYDQEYRNKIYDAALYLRQWFDEKQKELQDRGVYVDFKAHELARLEAKWYGEEDFNKAVNLANRIAKLQTLEFVHIPVQQWLNKDFKEYLQGKKRSGFNNRWKKIQTLITHRRRAIGFTDLLDRKLIKKEEIDPVTVMLLYTRKLAHDYSLLDIRDAAIQDGMLKVQKTKPKTKGTDKWVKIPERLNALIPGDATGKKQAWINSGLLEAIGNYKEAWSGQTWLQKKLSIIKMAQFFNPLFLPMYDMFQHYFMATSPIKILQHPIRNTIHIPLAPFKAIKTAFVDVRNETGEYLEAKALGMASKPYNLPFEKWRDEIEKVNSKSTRANYLKALAKDIIKQSFNIKTGSILKPLYEASWFAAWRLDESVRFMSYKYLIANGVGKQEAALVTAKMHGDYANVPAPTRRMLNQFFFTPTFKIAMGQLYKDMVMGAVKTVSHPLDSLTTKKKTTQYEREMASGLLGIIVANYAVHLLFTNLGFEDDEWGVKYTKKVWTAEGPKDLVLTVSHPGNLGIKYLFRIMRAFQPGVTNRFQYLVSSFKWEVHPLWRMMGEFINNSLPGGEKVYSTFDDPEVKAGKIMKHFMERTVGMWTAYKGLAGDDPSESSRKAWKKLEKDWDWATRVLKLFMFAYLRDPKYKQIGAQLNRLSSEFQRDMQKRAMEGKPVNKQWIQNYQERVNKIVEGLK